MIIGKIKIKRVGDFEFESMDELEDLVSNKESILRRKMS
jgi:hypothetical protein